MPRFAYSAYDTTGKLVRGEFDGPSDVEVLDHLAARNLTPVEIRQGGSALPWWQRDISLTGQSGALKPAEQERFFNTLAALLQAQFPLPQALRFCADQARDARSRQVLGRLQSSVENGATLQDAMSSESPAFPARLISLVGVGESANTLAPVAARTAAMLSEEAKLKRELRGALIYPVILLVMSALVMALIIFYLVPTLAPVFGSAGADVPMPLRIMGSVRAAVLEYWPLVAAVLGGLAVLLILARGSVSRLLGALATRLPIIGPFRRQTATLDICQTLSLMLASGAMLPQALATARDAAPGPGYKRLLEEASETIASGGTLAESLENSALFDPMTATLIRAGEEADHLPQVLETASKTLAERTRRTLAQMIQVLTPVLTLLIGFGVGGVILSTLSAIMDLNDIAF